MPVAIPLWLPPVLGLASCIVSGLTTFGDGLILLMFWNVFTVTGYLEDTALSLQTAVMYVTLLPLASLPVLLWAARKELAAAAGWAAVLSATTAAAIPLGTWALLFGSLDGVQVTIGVVFLGFGAVKLWLAVSDDALSAVATAGDDKDSDAGVTPRSEHSGTGEHTPLLLTPGPAASTAAAAAAGADSSPRLISGLPPEPAACDTDPASAAASWGRLPSAHPPDAEELMAAAKGGYGTVGGSAAGGEGGPASEREGSGWASPTDPASLASWGRTPASRPLGSARVLEVARSAAAVHAPAGGSSRGSPAGALAGASQASSRGSRMPPAALEGEEEAWPPHPFASVAVDEEELGAGEWEGAGADPSLSSRAAVGAGARNAGSAGGGKGGLDGDSALMPLWPPHCNGAWWAAVRSRFLPPISPNASWSTTLWVLLATGVGSGVLSGISGSGSAPQMVAFAQLKLSKESQRGIKVLATTVSNVVRLSAFIIASATGEATVFTAADWPSYLGVAAGSVVGAWIGTKLRERVSSEWLLRSLYVLLIVSTISQFNVIKRGPAAMGAFFGGLAVYCALLLAMRARPFAYARWHTAVGRSSKACARRLLPCFFRPRGVPAPAPSHDADHSAWGAGKGFIAR